MQSAKEETEHTKWLTNCKAERIRETQPGGTCHSTDGARWREAAESAKLPLASEPTDSFSKISNIQYNTQQRDRSISYESPT